MSENRKSFWSSIPGLVTGQAGLLTGIVGLVTVLIQLDVIGGEEAGTPSAAVSTTVLPSATTISGRLTVEPAALRLGATEREKTLTVRNLTNAPLTVLKPEYTGTDRAAFAPDAGCTNVVLPAGRSCTLKVTLSPTGPLKTYKANLVLEAKELAQATEVPVEASTLL